MEKNILILGMSTLFLNKENKVMPNRCTWENCEKLDGIVYYSQLEPISKMLISKYEHLDQIIILATPETRISIDFTLGNEEDEVGNKNCSMSAVQFYLHRIGKEIKVDDNEKNDIDTEGVMVINVPNGEDVANAINLSVNKIRKFMHENANAKLWIDTQGGFRNLNLVMNAIISLLKRDNISPSGIYSIKFDRTNKGPKPIVDQTATYKIFDFVSGINEFTMYGRADQLDEYYKHLGNEPTMIKTMKRVAENIQMCDMKGFDNELEELRKCFDKTNVTEDDLFGIFKDQIKNDYGTLLDRTKCTGIDIVEWLYNKKFYQQAITYIESKMPGEWCNNSGRGFIKYDLVDSNILSLHKKKYRKKFEKDENFILNEIVRDCFKWQSIVYRTKNNEIRCNIDSSPVDINGALNKDSKYKNFLDSKVDICFENQVYAKVWIEDRTHNKEDIMRLLLLYKLLKNERNNINHMSEIKVRASQEDLCNAIEMFIELGRKVYERHNIYKFNQSSIKQLEQKTNNGSRKIWPDSGYSISKC